VGHTVLLLLLVLVPLFRPGDLIDLSQRDYLRVLIYDPPPPPPPPLPRGTLGLARPKPREPAPQLAETPPLSESRLQAPIEALTEPVVVASSNDAEQAGSPTGSELGVPEGMEGGVEGGVVGGVLGGVLGGVIGGTGTGPLPVFDYDRPPRILRQTKPRYPPDAFVKKIQGTVLVELLIDEAGRVARARVVQSVPALDDAALEAVRGWAFVPAYKHGRPVATVARAPVSFRIY
jgi:protein TonB